MQQLIVLLVFGASLGFWLWKLTRKIKGKGSCGKACCKDGECKSKKG